MAWIAAESNNALEGKACQTMNGPALFKSGAFFIQYGTTTTTATAATSVISMVASATAVTDPISQSTAGAVVTLADDPTGKWPKSTLYLPGSKTNVTNGGMGGLPIGTVIKGTFVSTITTGGTFVLSVVLRNASTGAVAYTLTDTTTITPSATALGMICEAWIMPSTTGAVTGIWRTAYGTATYVAPPAVTTVDFTKDYILDAIITMGTSGTYVTRLNMFELVG